MYINLDEGRVANAAEAMDLPGLDDENVTGAGFEFLRVDGPEAPAFPDELDFIVRMPLRPGTTPGQGAEEEGGDIDVAVLGANEVVRAALKWQVLLTDTVHPAYAPMGVGYGKPPSVRQRKIQLDPPTIHVGVFLVRSNRRGRSSWRLEKELLDAA